MEQQEQVRFQQGGRRQRNIGVAITIICGQVVLTTLISKYWYGKCHTGHTAGALTVEVICNTKELGWD